MNLFKPITLIALGLFLVPTLRAQDSDTTSISEWEHSVLLNFYFFQDPFIFLPVYETNKGHLHLSARYNYEDIKTFSAWIGYNFMGGDMLEYRITPIAGAIIGNTDGFAGGALIQLDYKRFTFYSESEYVIDISGHHNNYYYNWTDLAYAATDWLYVGLSFQRTRLYQTEVEIPSGLLLGTTFHDIDITGYLYDPFLDDPFFILTLSKDF